MLHRDADLVAIDAGDPFGGGRMLPAGLLREPPGSLRRAHVGVLTRAEEQDRFEAAARLVRSHAPDLPLFRACHHPVRLRLGGPRGGERPVSELAGASVAAFAGLARPESLRATLESLGARVRRFDAVPDHHSYSSEEVAHLMEAGKRSGADLVITTAKDLVRLPWGEHPAGLAVLEIEMEVENLDGLVRRLLDLCLPASSSGLGSVEAGE